MPTTCVLYYTNNQTVYHTGDTVSGSVSLTLEKEKTLRGVYVEVYGKAWVRWFKTTHENKDDGTQKTVTKAYSGQESHLCWKSHFIGGTDDTIVVQPGTYNHSFKCILPAHLPSSVGGKFGCIHYGVRVVLDYKLWPDKEFNWKFTVRKARHLNAEPAMRMPLCYENVKKFMPCGFLFCWKSGPLRIIVRTPFSGYAPGQTILFTINMENQSNEEVIEVQAKLMRRLNWYAKLNGFGQRFNKESIDCMASVDGDISSLDQKQPFTLSLQVPGVAPTDGISSKLIAFEYHIDVIAKVDSCFSRNLKCTFPITIGTHPIDG